MIDQFINKFTNHNQQSSTDTPNLNSYLTLTYIGARSIKLGKRIAALFHDGRGTDIKTACQTYKINLYFNLKYSPLAYFCSNVFNQYTCSRDKNMFYIGMTTR